MRRQPDFVVWCEGYGDLVGAAQRHRWAQSIARKCCSYGHAIAQAGRIVELIPARHAEVA